ncbi:Chaperone protein DnaJ [Tetrabaena socialis]|uniref:Chaperone protein DnaJ n=1 Tax=Tetrabaena socialis TaxID=47790 RepID=A0A2J8ACK3_9CHLO|nr:Chaperone protein DnaJ [Tetrabaena socialis]|eukprot:PNH10249.1 Chaperone protein DnaJ [Tetrabaena socialis]
MLARLLNAVRSTSCRQNAIPLLRVVRSALGPFGEARQPDHDVPSRAGGGRRSYAASGDKDKELPGASLQALLERGVRVSVLEFELSAAEAVQRFEEYQRKSCMYLHAHSLLGDKATGGGPEAATSPGEPRGAKEGDGGSSTSTSSSLTAAYLPFWCFEATFSSEARTKLAFKDSRSGEVVWKDMDDPMALSSRAVASMGDPAMQVYASYAHVRDVGGGAAGAGLPLRARPLRAAEAEAGAVGGVRLHGATMRQGLAWQLAVRALVHQQRAAAEPAVKAQTKATDVKDLHVALQGKPPPMTHPPAVLIVHGMQVHSRSARLVFLPAYLAVYQYGTRYKQGTSGVIMPQMFTAAIGGTRDGRVLAPQHVSPAKASLSTGGLVGGLGLLAGDFSSWVPPLLGLPSLLPQLGAVEAVTLAALAASGAGMWAHQRPQSLRTEHAAKQVRADREFYKQYDKHETYGSGGAAQDPTRGEEQRGGGGNEEYMLWLWSDADWRRWEHDEPWNWDEAVRRKRAEELWRKQAVRRLERERYVERLAAEAQRRAAADEAEERREQRYGSSARYTHHGVGGTEGDDDSGRGQRRRRSDFLGYYRALGLHETTDAVSSDDIKQAFKAQALLLHPDKHVGSGAEAQRTTLVQFQKLQIAYDTLKDAEKRRLYDRGQLVE